LFLKGRLINNYAKPLPNVTKLEMLMSFSNMNFCQSVLLLHTLRHVSKDQKDPPPHISTTSKRKKRWLIVVGDPFLRGTEGPVCWADPPHREVCCLPGAWVRDITRKPPSLVRPSHYYPSLLFHVGGDEVAVRR